MVYGGMKRKRGSDASDGRDEADAQELVLSQLLACALRWNRVYNLPRGDTSIYVHICRAAQGDVSILRAYLAEMERRMDKIQR